MSIKLPYLIDREHLHRFNCFNRQQTARPVRLVISSVKELTGVSRGEQIVGIRKAIQMVHEIIVYVVQHSIVIQLNSRA